MDSIQDLLNQKAAQLDIHAKKSAYELIQEELDRYYDGSVKLKIIRRDGTAVITTRSASLASTVRYDQVRLLATMQSTYQQGRGVLRIQIVISS